MTQQEAQLIDAIKALSNHQVFPGSQGGCIRVCVTRTNGVKSQGVWLGRRGTIDNLLQIIAAAAREA